MHKLLSRANEISSIGKGFAICKAIKVYGVVDISTHLYTLILSQVFFLRAMILHQILFVEIRVSISEEGKNRITEVASVCILHTHFYLTGLLFQRAFSQRIHIAIL